ncbi:uncharacterized protein LOC144754026 [Lissotriton helveticus]
MYLGGPQLRDSLLEEQCNIWGIPQQVASKWGKQSRLSRDSLKDLEHLNLVALNVRFTNDIPSSATFHNTTASSTIDLTFSSLQLFGKILDFRIGTTAASDHLPQEITLDTHGAAVTLPVANEGLSYLVTQKRIKCKTHNLEGFVKEAKKLWEKSIETRTDNLSRWELFTSSLGTAQTNSKTALKNLENQNQSSLKKRSRNKEEEDKKIKGNTNLKIYKKNINKLLRQLHREGPNKEVQKELQKRKSTKKKLIWNLKMEAEEDLWAKLLHNAKGINTSGRFWKTVNDLQDSRKPSINSHITEEVWSEFLRLHFNTITNNSAEKPSELNRKNLDCIQQIEPTTMRFSEKQIISRIAKGKTEGAPGPNGIPPILYKRNPEYWAAALLPLFKQISETGTIPDSWEGSIIAPIHKKVSKNEPKNYRLVALIDNEAK